MDGIRQTQIRTVLMPDGEPWFVAKDVAELLGYGLTTNMTRMLDDDEKAIHSANTLGGTQSMYAISEAGLYSSIMRSKSPEAKPFRRWVTHEVLPTIRVTLLGVFLILKRVSLHPTPLAELSKCPSFPKLACIGW